MIEFATTPLHSFLKVSAQVPKLPGSENFWLPNSGSELADSIDGLFMFIMWVSVISVIGILGAMVYIVYKYRATSRAANEQALSQVDHSNTLEIIWSVAPIGFLVVFFVWGFQDYVKLRTTPKNSVEVHATAQKWAWSFKYPNGLIDSELHVPKDKNVRVIIKSTDVLHSLFIPEYRVKMDAVPGRYTELWFNPRYTGTFPIFCTEYCGKQHSDMLSQVTVHDGDGYDQWMAKKIKEIEQMPLPALGKLTFKEKGCPACHSIDGSPNVGPSLKGVFGKTENLVGGKTVTVDENYVRTSILEPMKDIVEGYPPQMPSFKGQLSDRRIDGLVEYIKSLK